MGKRQIAELQPSELVITILVSNIATLPLEDVTIPLTVGIVPMLSLVCLDVIMSYVTLKIPKVRKLVCGSPKIIIKDGEIDQKALADLRFSLADLYEGLRSQGTFSVQEVQLAIVETTGKISVFEKFEARNPTNADLNLQGSSLAPPEVIISDGKVIDAALNSLKIGMGFVEKILKEEKLDVKGVFLMTMNKNAEYYIVRKEKK
ncbi:MAG: DUF421 domain-containing protein [Oscillospiraceae bacterium]|nr:DUF421 domain-containing protein [Oscillospiraceae bacterium]